MRIRCSGAKKDYGPHVVAGRGDHLPLHSPELESRPGGENFVIHEALGFLAGIVKPQGACVPGLDQGRFPGGDGYGAAVDPLQMGVAPHVIGMPVGVDDPVKVLSAQGFGPLQQLQGALCPGDIAGIDEHVLLGAAQEHAVGAEPVAHDHVYLRRERRPAHGRADPIT